MPLTKTTAIDTIDAWQAAAVAVTTVGAAKSLTDSFETILYVELAITNAAVNDGIDVIIELSYADDEWVEFARFTTPSTDPTTTTLDGEAAATDTVIALTSSVDFNVEGKKWFILDGTIANSETVRTISVSTNDVTIAQDLIRTHATASNVYSEVFEWIVQLPFAAAQVRTSINNLDAGSAAAWTTRVSKVTALS